jgi:NADPH:quinone reductase-like Zn-dependent oxidoreductase
LPRTPRVPQRQLAVTPTNLTFEQAAAVPISGFAALQALRDTGGVQPGQQVVIIGASGGVGSFAVQLAKAFGAQVTAVCSTRRADLVGSIRADQVIDSTQQDCTRTGRRWDLLLELAGNRSLAESCGVRSPQRGRWCWWAGRVVGGCRGPVAPSARSWVSPFVGQRLRSLLSKPRGADLVVLQELIEAGKITPVIDRSFPLNQTPAATSYVGERSTQGKTVITV